jgi:hypothetical protein
MGLLELLIVILLIAWLLGAFAFPVGTSLIHVLLVVVLVLALLRWSRGRKVL